MDKKFQSYSTLEETENKKLDKERTERQLKELKLIKNKLEEHFNFKIESYIIHDIIENEDYGHFCSMVNLAVANDRLTESNGEILKQGIKEMFEIDADSECLNKAVVLGGFNYDKWYKKYHNEEIIDLKKYLDKSDRLTLKKLKIEVKNKILTNFEYDVLKGKVLEYYKDEEEMDALDLELCKPLEGTGVSLEEYNTLLNKFEYISKEFGIF